MKAMEKGFTSQLTSNVTINPFGLLPTLRIDAKSTFIIIGMIMSQIRMAMGIFTWLPSPHSKDRSEAATPGKNFPIAIPTTMQSPTHNVR